MSKKELETKKKSGVGKFILGALVGARKDLKNKMTELLNRAKEIDMDDVKETISVKIDEIKAEISDLDREKVLKIAKEKANDIKDKCGELVEYAKDKGTPVLEKAANEVREKAIDAVKEVLEKLEAADKKAKNK